MSPSPSDQLLVPELLRWSRWKGDWWWLHTAVEVTRVKPVSKSGTPKYHVCLISIDQHFIFSWKRQFRVSRSLLFNRLWSSKVRATILALRSMDEAGSCPQVKPGGANHDRKLIRQWSGNLLSTWAADTLQAPWWPRLDVKQLRIEFFPWRRFPSDSRLDPPFKNVFLAFKAMAITECLCVHT